MRPVEKLYEWLLTGAAPECDKILGEGLAFAEPVYAARIRALLFERANEASWVALLSRYDELSAEDQARVVANPELTRSALAIILRGGGAGARVNAINVLVRHPSLKLSYLLVDMLRDENPAIHRAAAGALRRLAELAIDQALFDHPVPGALDEFSADRPQLIRAMREALRTFDLHCRLEVLEASLWFARDLGSALWQKLDDRKAPVQKIVTEHLEVWNSPRMAGMLLECLTQQYWRPLARNLLWKWDQADHLIALLRNSDLLADPQIRRHLAGIKNPGWFANVEPFLSNIPLELRAKAPEWALLGGFAEPFRLDVLARWCEASEPGLQRAAIECVSLIDSPEAVQLLEGFANASEEVAQLVDILKSERSQSRAKEQEAIAAKPAPVSVPPDAPLDSGTDFADFWQVCRRRAMRDGADLIEMIRRNIELWRPRLLQMLKSTDPRDRVLVLRVIGTSEIAPSFISAVAPLKNDGMEGIRRLAGELLELAKGSHAAPSPVPNRAAGEHWPGVNTDEDRAAYSALVKKLLATDVDESEARAGVADMCELLVRCERSAKARAAAPTS